jgi:hypothetical protein
MGKALTCGFNLKDKQYTGVTTGNWGLVDGPTFDHMRIWMSSISINSIISWILGDETLLVNARPAESTARDLFQAMKNQDKEGNRQAERTGP